jgi:hypothetical protein
MLPPYAYTFQLILSEIIFMPIFFDKIIYSAPCLCRNSECGAVMDKDNPARASRIVLPLKTAKNR